MVDLLKYISIVSLGLMSVSASKAEAPLVVKNIEDIKLLQQKVLSVVERARPATVSLKSEITGSWGSGVVVSENGLILSAAHVVDGAKSMVVIFPDGTETKASVLGANKTKDTAMLQIMESGTYPFVRMGNSDELNVGNYLVAMGHAGGHDALRKPPVRFGRMVSRNLSGFFSSDCLLIGGDSGGPIFDLKAQLVGINSSIGLDPKANNHAGISGLKADWERLLKGEQWGALGLNPFADKEAPVIGFEMVPMQGRGVLIGSVRAGSAAEKASLMRGDLIRSINDVDIRGPEDLIIELNLYRPGQEVELVILRKGAQLKKTVTLMSRGELYKK